MLHDNQVFSQNSFLCDVWHLRLLALVVLFCPAEKDLKEIVKRERNEY